MRHNLAMPDAGVVKKFHDAGEVRRWCLSLADDPWFAINPVPISAPCFLDLCTVGQKMLSVATLTGLSVNGSTIRPSTWQAIGNVKQMIDEGRLFFLPRAPILGRRGTMKARAIMLTPPEKPPRPQPRVLPRGDYRYWSRCRSCGSRRYYAIDIGSAESAACYDCLPPHRLGVIGATVSTRRLQLDMVGNDEGTGLSDDRAGGRHDARRAE